MKPPEREKTDFEKINIDDFVVGEIEGIQYDLEHQFKGFQGAEDKVKPAIRFKFKIEGYKFSHYSRWMSFSLGEKSNLFLKYVQPLVEGAKPDMDLDLDVLLHMKVRMLWNEKNGFQSIETIRPIGKKISAGTVDVEMNPDEEFPEELKQEAPF